MPQMKQWFDATPSFAEQSLQSHPPRLVLLAPPDEPGVKRDTVVVFSSDGDQPAAFDTAICLLLQFSAQVTGSESCPGCFWGEPADVTERDGIRELAEMVDGFLNEPGPDVTVGDDDVIGGGLFKPGLDSEGF